MKNWMLAALTGLLMTAVLTNCSDDKKEDTKVEAPEVPTVDPKGLKIAFYYSDSLNEGFSFLKEQDSILKKKQEKFEKELQSRQGNIQRKYADFEAAQKAMILSGAEMQKKQVELERLSQSLQNYQQNEGAKLQQEAMEMQEVLQNKVNEFSKRYCEKYKLDMLLMQSPGGQFTYITPKMNVTKSFIEFVNAEQAKL